MIFATKENLFISYLKRDLVVSFRGKSASLNPLIFFVMIVLLMPLSLGSYSLALQKVVPWPYYQCYFLRDQFSMKTIMMVPLNK
jgi:hypothetical protein